MLGHLLGLLLPRTTSCPHSESNVYISHEKNQFKKNKNKFQIHVFSAKTANAGSVAVERRSTVVSVTSRVTSFSAN